MKKNHLKLALLLSGLSMLVFFSGCTLPNLPFLPNSNKPAENVTLKYWALWEPRTNVQALIDQYNQSHQNVTIEYEERSPKFYYETLKSRLTTGNGPDIFRMHVSWVPKLAPLGLSALPATVMDESTYASTFYPVATKWCTVSNQRYCVPLMYDGLALVYNQSMFEAAGINQPPRTWEEFRSAAKKLTIKDDKGNVTRSGAALGDSETVTEYSDLLGLLMLQNGAVMQNAQTGEVAFHNTISQDGRNTGAEALDFFTLFAKKGDDKTWDKSLGESTKAFQDGKVAMIFASSWRVQNILNANPSMKIIVAPVPQLPTSNGGLTNINWGSFWVEGVSAKSAHPAEAWDFLSFLAQKEQLINFQKTITSSSAARTFGEMYPRIDLASTQISDQYLGAFISGAPTAQTWYFCDRTWDEKLNDAVKGVMSQAITAVINGGDSVTSLKGAAQSIQTILTQKDE